MSTPVANEFVHEDIRHTLQAHVLIVFDTMSVVSLCTATPFPQNAFLSKPGLTAKGSRPEDWLVANYFRVRKNRDDK